jgi:Domain of unknown function (DUF5615)
VTIETAEAGLEGRDDGGHLAHCRREGLILVTLDGDFMDDRRYPIGHQTPGIIHVVSSSEGDIFESLATLLGVPHGDRVPAGTKTGSQGWAGPGMREPAR